MVDQNFFLLLSKKIFNLIDLTTKAITKGDSSDTLAELLMRKAIRYNELKEYQLAEDDLKRAESYFKKYVSNNHPTLASIYIHMYTTYSHNQEEQKGIKILEKVDEIYKSTISEYKKSSYYICYLIQYGNALKDCQQVEKAQEILERAVKLAPFLYDYQMKENTELLCAQNSLAKCYELNEQYSQATELYLKILKASKENPNLISSFEKQIVLDNLSVAQLFNSQELDALETLKQVFNIITENKVEFNDNIYKYKDFNMLRKKQETKERKKEQYAKYFFLKNALQFDLTSKSQFNDITKIQIQQFVNLGIYCQIINQVEQSKIHLGQALFLCKLKTEQGQDFTLKKENIEELFNNEQLGNQLFIEDIISFFQTNLLIKSSKKLLLRISDALYNLSQFYQNESNFFKYKILFKWDISKLEGSFSTILTKKGKYRSSKQGKESKRSKFTKYIQINYFRSIKESNQIKNYQQSISIAFSPLLQICIKRIWKQFENPFKIVMIELMLFGLINLQSFEEYCQNEPKLTLEVKAKQYYDVLNECQKVLLGKQYNIEKFIRFQDVSELVLKLKKPEKECSLNRIKRVLQSLEKLNTLM